MVMNRFRILQPLALAFGLALMLSPAVLGQEYAQSSTRARTVTSGEKMKIKGVVVKRDADTFTVRDANGVDTVARLTDRTSVKTNGGFLRSGTNYGATNILRGLNLEVEGRGDASGELIAEKVRFNDSDLRVARAVESRADPLETKLSEVEQNSQR